MDFLTRAKSINEHLLHIYARNNIPALDTAPRRIQIIPTMRCNYRCIMCFQPDAAHACEDEIDMAILAKLEGVLPFVREVYFTGGEPLMYSAFAETMEYFSRFGCELSMSTNGSLLRGRKLEMAFRSMRMIKVSLDAATPDTYAAIRRNGDLAKVVDNLTQLVKLKIRHNTPLPEINFSMVAMRSNIAELPALVRLAHSLGGKSVRVAHAAMQHASGELLHQSLHYHKALSDKYMLEAAEEAQRLGVQLILPRLFGHDASQTAMPTETYETGICHEPWEYLLINPNGTTALCCSNVVGGGDLRTQSFDEMWNSRVAQHIRRRLNTHREPAACAKCLTYKRGQAAAVELPDAAAAAVS